MAIKRSNRGNPIDIDALRAQAPKQSPAVGNMRVNAAGDRLGKGGKIVERNEERVRKQYANTQSSSSDSVSIKGPARKSTLPVDNAQPTPAPPVAEPDEFEAPVEPIGYKEVEDADGNIEMVPYYREEDAPE
jgi:hypothetical protein